uniref:Uncharacterized protein n=1 Tax=viral metagenome TaxID=1070528 RepID=A0A6C0D4Z5_9ZZZZ
MTGHRPNSEENQEFLSTMHTMIDDLDTISSAIDEHTYLRLVNGLQRLYNIHNSELQASTRVRETWVREQRQIFNEENNVAHNISSALIRHYERVNDISGVPINADAYPVNSIINPTIANVIDYINNDYWNENNPAQNRDIASASANASANASARISYTSVTSNHWIETALRESLRSAH